MVNVNFSICGKNVDALGFSIAGNAESLLRVLREYSVFFAMHISIIKVTATEFSVPQPSK
jgi:hypothetical protein